MKPTDYFDRHQMFRFDDFAAAHAADGRRSRQTTVTVLKQQVASGRLLHLRRDLYASVPRGTRPRGIPSIPTCWQRSSPLTAWWRTTRRSSSTARPNSLWNRCHYLTRGRQRRFTFGDQEFVPVQVPVALRDQPDLGGWVVERPHAGGVVRVTTLERSLVDALDAPERNSGWEEVWCSLEMDEFFDLDAVLA